VAPTACVRLLGKVIWFFEVILASMANRESEKSLLYRRRRTGAN
jgi:hypothetical protein